MLGCVPIVWRFGPLSKAYRLISYKSIRLYGVPDDLVA
jgi:hypothetical protein